MTYDRDEAKRLEQEIEGSGNNRFVSWPIARIPKAITGETTMKVYSPRTAEVIGVIQTQDGEMVFIPESMGLSESTVRYVVDRMAELKDRR